MTERINKTRSAMKVAGLLAGAILGVQAAQADTWQKTAGGTYSWMDGTAWNTAFPNAVGALANFNIDMAGNQTVNLNQPITIGTLNAGDTAGSPASTLTIGSGTGGNPLVFQGASAGAATAINLTATAQPDPSYMGSLNLNSGISLGGTSPLTVTLNGSITFGAGASSTALNGNTCTVTCPYNATYDPGVITGSGNFVVKGPGQNVTSGGTGGVVISHDMPNFTGTLSVNDGHFGMVSGSLMAVSQINVSGAFLHNDKYPIGSWLQIGDGGYPAVSTLPDRLNHNAVMAFNGGYLDYRGQCLDSSLTGQAVLEQVRQIRFTGGQSEIRMSNSNNISTSTTFLANDPTNACVRMPGATVIVGGDDAASANNNFQAAMGVVEKLKFASGMSQYLIGGGGAAGSQNVSIIPWMSIGTLYHPNMELATYDSTNGVRCLTANEYYTGTVPGAPATANVLNSDLNLGANGRQTINSYMTASWGNTDIGPGSILTVTSGLISFQASPGQIGNGAAANAGTINFGSAEGILWANCFPTDANHYNYIGSVLAGSGGLTKTGNANLILKGANTYTGKTFVNSGILQIGDSVVTLARLGQGDVEISGGAGLIIKANTANAIYDLATVTLDDVGDQYYGVMSLEAGINEKVGGLILNGVVEPAGTYGSSSSSATHKLDNYFSGAGILTVVSVPEPTSLALLGLAGLLLRRRRK
jgi:autotransporter-associated beta strand protein